MKQESVVNVYAILFIYTCENLLCVRSQELICMQAIQQTLMEQRQSSAPIAVAKQAIHPKRKFAVRLQTSLHSSTAIFLLL